MRKSETVAAAMAVALVAAGSAPGAALAQDESMSELVAEGKTLFFDNCAPCHGSSGEGTENAPALDGNANVGSRPLIINQILWGNEEHGMPPFADALDDRDIAAIATYVRNSWKNDYGIVFPRSVELRR